MMKIWAYFKLFYSILEAAYLKYSRYRVLPLVYYFWQERFTATGRALLTAAMLSFVPAVLQKHMIGGVLFSGFVALFTIELIWIYLSKPHVDVKLLMADRCVAGSEITIKAKLENQTKHDLNDIGLFAYRMPRGIKMKGIVQYVATLSPTQTQTIDCTLVAKTRGQYTFQLPAVFAAGPFHLMHARRRSQRYAHLTVYPEFKPLVSMQLPGGLRYQIGGLPMASKVGNSSDFMETREYQVGDRVQNIHARSWARVGYPVVRQFQEEYLSRVAVMVDTYLPSLAIEQTLESALSLTAAISDYLARQDNVVDLFAAGDKLYHLQAGRSLAYLDNILDILACVAPTRTDHFDQIGAAFEKDLQQVSTVVLILLHWNKQRAKWVDHLQEAGVHVKVYLIADQRMQAVHTQTTPAYVARFTNEQIKQGVDVL